MNQLQTIWSELPKYVSFLLFFYEWNLFCIPFSYYTPTFYFSFDEGFSSFFFGFSTAITSNYSSCSCTLSGKREISWEGEVKNHLNSNENFWREKWENLSLVYEFNSSTCYLFCTIYECRFRWHPHLFCGKTWVHLATKIPSWHSFKIYNFSMVLSYIEMTE